MTISNEISAIGDRSNSLKLVQVNFQHQKSATAEAQQAALERAHKIAQVSGLIWKVWIDDGNRQEAGGIYLFQDEAAARAYLEGEIFTRLKEMPGVSAMQVKLFDVNAAPSAVTRAPLGLKPQSM